MLLFFAGCKNPFSPAIDTTSGDSGTTLSGLTTLDGIFQNFQYAYAFQDTSIYSKLISSDFVFTYRDYDQGFDVSWGRDEEMKTTNGLFRSTQRLDLIWNNIILSVQDSVSANIVRGFNLTVTFNPTDVVRIDGRVNLNFRKASAAGNWQLISWKDESNF